MLNSSTHSAALAGSVFRGPNSSVCTVSPSAPSTTVGSTIPFLPGAQVPSAGSLGSPSSLPSRCICSLPPVTRGLLPPALHSCGCPALQWTLRSAGMSPLALLGCDASESCVGPCGCQCFSDSLKEAPKILQGLPQVCRWLQVALAPVQCCPLQLTAAVYPPLGGFSFYLLHQCFLILSV